MILASAERSKEQNDVILAFKEGMQQIVKKSIQE